MIKFWWETEFKETEIGKIPEDWEVKKMRDLFKIESGRRPPEVNDNGKFEVWGANGFMGYTTSYNYCGEFLITGRVGTLGHVFYIPENIKIWVSDNALIITKDKDKVIVKLYFYYLKTRKREIEELNVGSTQPLITQRDLKEIKIPYPPPPEQSRIATVLSWFDDLIENKKRQNEILEKVAMAIFKSWFVDFEPFKDEKFVYNEELGKDIPKGWEVKSIGEIFDLIKGKKCTVFERPTKNAVPYLLIENFKGGDISYWTTERQPFLEELDIVLVADGESSGKIFRYQRGIIGSTLLMLRQKVKKLDLRNYVYLYLKNAEDEIMEHRTGSAIPHLDKDFLREYVLIIPVSHVLQRFHSLVEPLFQKIILNQKQIMVLRKIRNALLPKLVFGKLRVEEV
ncbi:MAG: Restriction endonuclease S subunit [Thermodesulfobacterium sp.]|uniref:Restriction endonuclease S subunit n=1 Tax=Candidatus Thermodesulfobacterium syntrophicum TaxID=3060442 RepID=A0AAE3P4F1_9BACT|nr:Restriction endonuclease S subunit [Candidatus Thermodesulfobacterium syntrophicum]